ncbi:hypothetical protein KR222_004491 [Zaprionus bogoriensis]|nr:hypothetical protein KR222_004491 [Zaprionus bogoriensis]
MSAAAGKVNIIDESTYQSIKRNSGEPSARTLRSAKYKQKHKQQQQQKCSLLDFLVVPRKQQGKGNKQQQQRVNFNVARKSVHFPTKRKGKTRLIPKLRVSRLKRIIRGHRKWKQRVVALKSLEVQPPAPCELPAQLQRLSLSEKEQANAVTEKQHTDLEKIPAKHAAHKIHSRRFRSYCDNCTTARLKELSTQLLRDLQRFQARAFANNEIKARAHPRYVLGFREAWSRLRIHKVRLLLLAPDCEECSVEGGLDDTIEELKRACREQSVPYCFSLLRREMAYTLRKRAQICCVAVLDYDGANETHRQLLQELHEARTLYGNLLAA